MNGEELLQSRSATAEVDLDGTIDGLPPGRYAKLAITDTGTGMDAETCRRAFEPFFTTKPIGKGTGLGLAMAFGAVRSHGGSIAIASELGKGTTMTIYLPATEASPTLPSTSRPTPTLRRASRPGRRRRQLHVVVRIRRRRAA